MASSASCLTKARVKCLFAISSAKAWTKNFGLRNRASRFSGPAELLALGRLLKAAYDALGKDNPFSRKHRAPTAVTSDDARKWEDRF